MSAIHKKYNIPFDAYIQMVKDGVISTDVILQFEYAETFKILSQGYSLQYLSPRRLILLKS